MINLTEIVFLDAFTTNPGDLSWNSLEALGKFTSYKRTTSDQIIERAKHANVIITNKVEIDAHIINQLPRLELICVAATGYNNIDINACSEKSIPVCNVSNYSSASVAQHVFAGLLSYLHKPLLYNLDVRKNGWSTHDDFAYTWKPIKSLSEMTMGIFGFGNIGRHVARIANSMGMNVIAVNKHPERDRVPYVENVSWDELLKRSDVVSLHAPLNASTAKIINSDTLSRMKSSAILINTARGGLIDESALAEALKDKQICAAILDVLSNEPPEKDHPLFDIKNCYITPHQAWINNASRKKLLKGLVENIKAYQGRQVLINQVNKIKRRGHEV